MRDVPTLAPTAPAAKGSERLRAYLDSTFVDHGFLRALYPHRFRVTPSYYRSSQPGPRQLRWARDHGIRTVVNLRGRRDGCGSYILERDACHSLGLKLVNFPTRSRDVPKPETVFGAHELFNTIEYPILVHCKAGMDRVGFMTVLYLFLQEGVPLDRALRALSLRYGHIKTSKTGRLTHFFRWYQRRNAEEPIDFLDWVATEYDPKQINADFRSSYWSNVLVDRILRRE